MKQEETKARLQEGTICAVAHEGLDKASTKLISYEANVNEVFIFRYFAGKDNLLDETFARFDNEIVLTVLTAAREAPGGRFSEERVSYIVGKAWDFLIGKRKEVLFYMRYYYSAGFLRIADLRHRELVGRLARELFLVNEAGDAAVIPLLELYSVMMNAVYQALLDNYGGTSRYRLPSIGMVTDMFLCGLKRHKPLF